MAGDTARLNRRGRVVVLALVLLLVFGILGGGAFVASRLFRSAAPADFTGAGTGSVVVHVVAGDSATAIGQRLVTAGVVRSVGAFQSAADADNRAAGIQPGYYRLPRQVPAKAALAVLVDPGNRLLSSVTIPEGTSLKTLLPLLADKAGVPLAELKAAAGQPAQLGLPGYAQGHVEGFLFPSTYQVPPRATAVAVLRLMTQRFTQTADALHLEADAAKIGRTPLQVVTIASIIERESAAPQDAAKVAAVFYNRLHAGLPLGSEFTVRYAGGDKNSPYNTYTHKGFPPGPYDSPGKATLDAALHPASLDALYFVTLPREGTQFAKTEQGFAQLAARCRAEGGCR